MLSVYSTQRSVFVIRSALEVPFRSRWTTAGLDYRWTDEHIWVCLKMLCTPKPNGFADHYPY